MNPAEAQQVALQAAQQYDQGNYDEADRLSASVLNFYPDAPMALQVSGFVRMRRGDTRRAIELMHQALAIQPDLSVSHNGLGCCYYRLGEIDKAEYHYDRAAILQPHYPVARFSRGEIFLKTGRYREGWVEYEWRWNAGLVRGPQIPRPRWDGSPLAGRSILVHTEQGVGDVLMMVRLFPMLKAQGCRLVFACHKPLKKLLGYLPEVDRWFPIDEPSNIDFEIYSPLLCLPGLLGLDEKTIPRAVPYIRPDPERVEHWRPRINALPGFKIGICWQGSPTFEGDAWRSIPLSHYAALAQVPGVTLVSLQKLDGLHQIEANKHQVPLTIFPDLDSAGAFVDSAAIMQHLDLVITSDTAIAHLAGALGRPGWVMLNTGCDWRWGRDTPECIWYPSLRLFRQKTHGDWAGVAAEVAEALKAAVAGGPVAPPRPDRHTVVTAPAAAGEVIDKITILQIKSERISDPAKRANVRRELDQLDGVWKSIAVPSAELDKAVAELKQVNEKLWVIEDDIRLCEKAGDFGEKFVRLARAVYQNNDRRSALKRQVNELLGSEIVEEKSYA